MKKSHRLSAAVILIFIIMSLIGCTSSGSSDDETASLESIQDTGLTAGFGKEPIISMTDDISDYWMAGFFIWRPVSGIHDPIYAVATVLDDGINRIAIVALDSFSIRLEDTEAIRDSLPKELGIRHVIVHALHNHEVPDNNGMWSTLNMGAKEKFIGLLKESAKNAIIKAADNMEPAKMYLGQVMDKDRLVLDDPLKVDIKDAYDQNGIDRLANPNELGLADLRPPYITDNGVRFAVVKSADDMRVLGTIVNWGNHVETLWRNNEMISADFAGCLRDGLSRRIGGTTMFITGNVGAVTTPEYEPEVFFNTSSGKYETVNITTGVTYKGTTYYGATEKSQDTANCAINFKKAWAQGNAVADVVADAVESGSLEPNTEPRIKIYKERFEMQFQNQKFYLVWALGIMKREGHKNTDGENVTWTEMNVVTIGDLWMLTIPGELYPEIAVGGIDVPENRDYNGKKKMNIFGKKYPDVSEPVEVPALRTLMNGKVNMIMNLGNDHLGYLIPKTEWNEKEPYIYGYSRAPYGEENSLGPDAAGIMHKKAIVLLKKAQRDLN